MVVRESETSAVVPPLAKRHRPWRRRLVWWAAALLVASPFAYLSWSCSDWFLRGGPMRQIESRERQILYQLDPNVLLAACRQIRANQALFRANPDWHPTQIKGGDKPDPADPQMPPVIATLRPCTIGILPDGVRIELGGGFYHYGVAEQLPGAPVPALGVKQLAPGLWYYAEDGRVPPP